MKNQSKLEVLKLYFWTLSYFKPFILPTLLYIMCGGAMIWGELMIPRRMGYIIDQVLPSGSMIQLRGQALFLCWIVVLILAVKVIYSFLEQVISNKIVKNQQTDLMHKLQALGFSYYEKVPTGEILSLFENAVRETQLTYTFLFPHLVYAMAQFIVPAVILIKGEPLFFIAAMIGNVVYAVLNRTANKKILYYLDIETKAAQKLQQSLYDAIVAKKEVAASGSQNWLIEKTMNDFDKFRVPRMWSIFWRHFRFTTVGFTLTISVAIFYFFGLGLIKSGDLLLGEFIGYSFLMGLLSRGFSVFFYIIPAQLQALNYARLLYEFMSLEPEVNEIRGGVLDSALGKDIEFKNVSFSYNTNQKVIDNVSLTIPYGKKVAIVGESGCGKSTMLKLIGRFYDVTKGEILIGSHNVKKLDLECLRNSFGYVFQDTYLFNMSIKDNIRFGKPDATDDEVVCAAKSAGAHAFILDTEEGYNTITGERGIRLSGGQKQRISIARMILKDPEVILLDEATSALDNVTEAYVKETIDKLSFDKTIITVAHRLSTIMEYDHIVYLENGKLVEQGTYQDLMSMKGSFYRLALRGSENEV